MATIRVKDDSGVERDFYRFWCKVSFGLDSSRDLYLIEGMCSMYFTAYPILGTFDRDEAAAELHRLNALLEAN